jgi:hypothetical protein
VVDAGLLRALGELDERPRQVPGPGRAADLVGHDGDLLAPGAEHEHGVDEVAPAGAVQPRGAHDDVGRVGGGDELLAGQLRLAVDAQRRHRIGLHPRLALGAVEDVVRRDVHDPRPDLLRGRGHVAGAAGVDGLRQAPVGLRAVDVGVRGAVHDRRRADLVQHAPRGGRVGHVELGPARGVDVVAQRDRPLHDGPAEHPAGPRDEQLHRIPISELSPTMKR